MLDKIIGSFMDKGDAVVGAIQGILESVAEELQCSPNEFFVMIKGDSSFNPKAYIYKVPDHGPPKLVRELSIEEIKNMI